MDIEKSRPLTPNEVAQMRAEWNDEGHYLYRHKEVGRLLDTLEATAKPELGAIAPWYGSNRLLAENVGKALGNCAWVGIPFAGGCCELPFIKARTIVANDLHRNLIALATVIANPALVESLIRRVDAVLFHEDVLAFVQHRLKGARREPLGLWSDPAGEASELDTVERAAAFFICVWMSRSGVAGTSHELRAKLSTRWTASGGDSVRRYRHAVEDLRAWHRLLVDRVTFRCMPANDFVRHVKDVEDVGLYCDPPFPDRCGDKYLHSMSIDEHQRFAELVSRWSSATVVMRFHESPIVRELYREADGWEYREATGRTQTNADAAELLVVKNARDEA